VVARQQHTNLASLPPQVSPPEFALSDLRPHAIRGAEAIALPVLPGPEGDESQVLLGPGADEIAELLDLDPFALLELNGATGKAGEITSFPVPLGAPDAESLRWVHFVGVGEQRPADLRRAGATLARATRDRSSVATSIPAVTPDGGLEAFVVGVMLGSFVFHWRSQPPERVPVARVVLAGLPKTKRWARNLDRAIAVGGAGWRARMIAAVPSNLKNPGWLADQAVVVADESGLKSKVWDVEALTAGGFGGILGVGQASATPPRMIELDYRPPGGGRGGPRVVLVGKGITFDTGGLSIKPGESMVNMKRDVTGGAVVLAVMAPGPPPWLSASATVEDSLPS